MHDKAIMPLWQMTKKDIILLLVEDLFDGILPPVYAFSVMIPSEPAGFSLFTASGQGHIHISSLYKTCIVTEGCCHRERIQLRVCTYRRLMSGATFNADSLS